MIAPGFVKVFLKIEKEQLFVEVPKWELKRGFNEEIKTTPQSDSQKFLQPL